MNEALIKKLLDFRKERNWEQFHNPKDLALSLTLEAAELLENFQWISSEEAVVKNKDKIVEELADVFMYSIYIAEALDVNIEEIILKKLKKNEAKYPVEKAYGRSTKYTEL